MRSCFRISMKSEDCTERDSACFANAILNRYRSESIFEDCEVSEINLNATSSKNSIQFFQNKISTYIRLAKNEYILKQDLQKKLDEYKTTFINNIKNRVSNYVSKLQSTGDAYVNFYYSINDLVNLFESKYNKIQISDSGKGFTYEYFLGCGIFTLLN